MEVSQREAERARERYLRRVRRLLPMKPRERSRLLAHLRLSVGGELPDGSYEELRSRFGEPEELAAACAEGWTARELLVVMRFRRLAMQAVAIASLVALLSVGGFLWILLSHLPIDTSHQNFVFEIVSNEILSDAEAQEIIRNSPEYAAAFGPGPGEMRAQGLG